MIYSADSYPFLQGRRQELASTEQDNHSQNAPNDFSDNQSELLFDNCNGNLYDITNSVFGDSNTFPNDSNADQDEIDHFYNLDDEYHDFYNFL